MEQVVKVHKPIMGGMVYRKNKAAFLKMPIYHGFCHLENNFFSRSCGGEYKDLKRILNFVMLQGEKNIPHLPYSLGTPAWCKHLVEGLDL